MRVEFSPKAQADLQSIFDYLAQRSVRAAETVLDRLDTAAQELGHAALRYPLFPERAEEGVRKRTVRPYVIFYRVGSQGVEILRVMHGARDLEQAFGEDG